MDSSVRLQLSLNPLVTFGKKMPETCVMISFSVQQDCFYGYQGGGNLSYEFWRKLALVCVLCPRMEKENDTARSRFSSNAYLDRGGGAIECSLPSNTDLKHCVMQSLYMAACSPIHPINTFFPAETDDNK